jgi:glycosyltransferase involved in cell wall biosynthesis
MKLRILFLIGTLEAGGLERFVTRVSIRAKVGGEFEPVAICLRERRGIFLRELEKCDVDVYEAPYRWFREPAKLVEFGNLIREISPEIVHSQVNFSMVQQMLALRLGLKKNIRPIFCVTERNCYPLTGFDKYRRILQYYILKTFGANYSANSDSVAKHLGLMLGINPEYFQVLPNGVQIIKSNPDKRKEIRSSLGWKKNEIGIGYVARMAAHKGHLLFLQVIHKLLTLGLPIKACLVGDGPQRKELERVIGSLEINGDVTLIGIVPNVEDYLQAFDLVALFSSREGMPNVILEAMAAKKPIVATNAGAIPELLDYGRAGIVIQDLTVYSIMKEISELIVNEEKRQNYGRKALERVERNFNLDKSFEILCEYYKSIS